ncbi:RNA 2',3'-cyclic phosphodiesterase [Wenzhouxiangella sp. EGI_FJ10305]|uniref:RNA 2',3'-cyclic phosphodiesterase n=1 Tax=Wenzhouxiangella sp. EGI_FJ10305 TaxID=3243768 RepID=UPI0035D81DBF
MVRPQSTRRLFFALWPDEKIRREIVERREMLGRGSLKRVPDHNLHLTLLFLGDQPAERLGEFEAAADAIRGKPCELRLDRFGWFPGAGVLWLGGEAPETLQALQAALYARIGELGIDLDRRPFRPHVTLFRKVARRPDLPTPSPLSWPVREFALVESIPGQPYRRIGRWSIRGGGVRGSEAQDARRKP